MRVNFGAKPMLYPMPALIIAAYNADGTPNAMNAAWGGICGEKNIAICVDAGHKTMKNILERRAFTVSMANEANLVAADFVGIVSGNKEPGKFEKAGWHAQKSEFVDAPLICELPMALECKLVSYDADMELLIGEIVNVCVEEEILSEGKIDPAKLRPISYDPVNHDYLLVYEKAGKAFSDGKQLK